MSLVTIAFGLMLLSVLTGLFVWARLRASRIAQDAAVREQAALATMLAAASREKKIEASAAPAEVGVRAAMPAEHAKTVPAGLDIRDLPSAAVKELPPLEFAVTKPARSQGPDAMEALMSQIVLADGSAAASKPTDKRAEPAQSAGADVNGSNVPLRELVLAWYEARGYRAAPASPAVRPIELVLRHRDDAARAYAFVVQSDYVTEERITAIITQARSIGMKRITLIANAGFDNAAKEVARKKHVRLIDRNTMDAELAALELETVAKIIAVARTRAAGETSLA